MADALTASWIRGFARPDRRPLREWAASVNLQGDYDPTGPFHVETSRHLILPLDLLDDPRVRMINELKAVQTGGSLVADLFFQSVLARSPAPMMMTYQTDDDAEQHYLTRIEKTLRATACNRAALERLHKKRDLYQFPSMNVYFQGANMNSLQRKSVKYEVNDEVWDWPAGMLGEAWARTERYARSCKILNISQGGDEGTDWELTYNSGRRYDWAVRCQRCGHLQSYAFFAHMLDDPTGRARAGVVWDDVRLADGKRVDLTRAAASARFRCCRCGHDHPDEPATWDRFNAAGDYLCLDPERSLKDCSVHWNSLVNGRYGDLVREFLLACETRDQGSTVPLEKFYKKKLAQFWSLSTSQERVTLATAGYLKEPALERGYKPAPLAREYGRFLTADFQEGRGNDVRHFVVVCRAWLDDGASRLLWEGRVDSPEQLRNLQVALAVADPAVCIDGGHALLEVAKWCARYGWTILIGDPTEAKSFTHRRKGKSPVERPFTPRFQVDPLRGKAGAGAKFAYAFKWSGQSVRGITYNLRHGRGPKWELPADLSADYRAQIDSFVLKRILDRKSGRPRYIWAQTQTDDHFADAEHMQTVCALIAEILPFDLSPDDVPPGQGSDTASRKPESGAGPAAPHDQPEQLELLVAP